MHREKKRVGEIMNETLTAVNNAFQMLNAQARVLVQKMISQGTISNEDGLKFVSELGEKIKIHRDAVEALVISRIDTAVSKFNASTQGQVEELSKKVAQLSKEIEKVSGWKPGKKK
jgi:polyhydroxyalkanoate synthesis regulator phasin